MCAHTLIDYVSSIPSAGFALFIHQAFLCPSHPLSRLPDLHPLAAPLSWGVPCPSRLLHPRPQHRHSSQTPPVACPLSLGALGQTCSTVPRWVTQRTLPHHMEAENRNNTRGAPRDKATNSFPQEPPHDSFPQEPPHGVRQSRPSPCPMCGSQGGVFQIRAQLKGLNP